MVVNVLVSAMSGFDASAKYWRSTEAPLRSVYET
jgi:hypothetical protein